MESNLAGGLALIAAVRDDGADMKHFCKQVVGYLRNLLLAKTGALDALDLPCEAAEEAKEAGRKLNRDRIVEVLRAFALADFRDDSPASGGSLPLELALMEVASRVGTVLVPGTPPVPQVAAAADDGSVALEPSLDREMEAGPQPEVPARAVASAEGMGLLERVRQGCKDTDRQLSGLLNGSCEVKSEEADVVTLGFYHTFHLERIESGPYAKRLEELFSGVLGRPVRVTFEHAPRERVARPAAKGGHLVEAARQLGARPIGSASVKGGPDGEPRRDES